MADLGTVKIKIEGDVKDLDRNIEEVTKKVRTIVTKIQAEVNSKVSAVQGNFASIFGEGFAQKLAPLAVIAGTGLLMLEVAKKTLSALEKNSIILQDAFLKMSDATTLLLRPIADRLGTILDPVGDAMLDLGNKWEGFTETQFGDVVADALTGAGIGAVVGGIAGSVVPGAGTAAGAVLGGATGGVLGAGASLLDKSFEAFDSSEFGKKWKEISDNFMNKVKSAVDDIDFSSLKDLGGKLLDKVLNFFTQGFQGAFDLGTWLFNLFVEKIPSWLKEQFNLAKEVFDKTVEKLGPWLSEKYDLALELFNETKSTISGWLSEKLENVTSLSKWLYDKAKDFLSGIWSGAVEYVTDKLFPKKEKGEGNQQGGIFSTPKTITVGEGPYPEAVVPLSGRNSFSSQASFVFSPTISVTTSSTQGDRPIIDAKVKEEIFSMFKEFQRNSLNAKTRYGVGIA